MGKHTFTTTLYTEGAGLYFEVPLDIKALFGEARPPVKVKVDHYSFHSRVMVYGGKYFLALRKAQRAESGLESGQKVRIALERDDSPRVVEPPDELAAALTKDKLARAGWEAMSFTHQREYAMALADAKKPETRARRLEQTLTALRAKATAKKARG